MRLGLVADIHSNLHALRAVRERLDALGVDAVVCAGDIVGYGAFPNECCAAVSHMADLAVVGNHDLAALTRDMRGLNPYAAAASRWTSDQLGPEASTYLSGLKEKASLETPGRPVAVMHGSPRGAREYVFEDDAADWMLEETGAGLLVLGHTHVPFVARFAEGMVVNPGSVGQPRDGDPRASFAVYDQSSSVCTVVRAVYDVDGAAEAIRAAGLPRILAERLKVGK